MDTNDIIVVLRQASELHAKISHAMDRVVRYGREIKIAETVPVINKANGNCKNEDINHLSPEHAVAMEVRSLASIRDSLDVLEDQLYCLQILQDQKRADMEAALTDMEETREILLQRLRKYQGKEWGVVQEALAFVGEPTDEEHNPTKYSCDEDPRHPLIKRLGWLEEKKEQLLSESKGFLKSLCHGLGKSMGSAVSMTSKTALVVAGIVILSAVSKMGKNQLRNRDTRKVIAGPSCPPNDQNLKNPM
ncbi:plastid division protein PDV2 [Cryptomeria japonica]|uniref:plastid division protein PDV2 n=1 Tax=Cryptomeria japonica TaxID=3369 RepID=UPI0027DA810E|nr:plastid division protein PDV2 [Cryptomeria japonica]